MPSLQFTERMAGTMSFFQNPLSEKLPLKQEEFQKFEEALGRKNLEFTLTISIDNVDRFLIDPNLTAKASGTLTGPINLLSTSEALGEQAKTKNPAGKTYHKNSSIDDSTITIEKGTFNLFVKPDSSSQITTAKEMHYLLYFHDSLGNPLTLFGYKAIEKEDGTDLWKETTTLYTAIWKGHFDFQDNQTRECLAIGILHISMGDFLKQLGTFSSDSTGIEKFDTMAKFFAVFAKNIWEAYAPFFMNTPSSRWNEHYYPIFTDIGVAHGKKETVPITTDDGLTLALNRFCTKPSKDVVLLLHGLTTSTDMFIMPEHQNLVNFLHQNGFSDVWSFDWRGSGRFVYNLSPHRFTIDDIAQYDVPAAIQKVREIAGKDINIHVICHCVGSVGFMTSLAAGKATGIKSVISNSVSLTPKVRWQTRLKLLFGPFVLEYLLRYHYIGPKVPYFPGFGSGKWIYWMERLLRRECREPACHMLSFMWGWGFPAVFKHENLHPLTHRRLPDLFGGTSFHYYRHIRKMVFKGEALPYSENAKELGLPESYLKNMNNIEAPPILFISGSENLIFPDSNKHTYHELKKLNPRIPVEFLEIPGYGHQDVFMGKNVHVDVFPLLLTFLKQHKAPHAN